MKLKAIVVLGLVAFTPACHHHHAAAHGTTPAAAAHGTTPAATATPEGTPQVSIAEGRLTVSEKIHFEENSDVLKAESTHVLDAVVAALHGNTSVTSVSVEGHTDALGTPEHNQDLSRRRAQTVANYLTSHGVTQTVQVEGHGSSRPLCHETTEDCHAQNRRVEFIVGSN